MDCSLLELVTGLVRSEEKRSDGILRYRFVAFEQSSRLRAVLTEEEKK